MIGYLCGHESAIWVVAHTQPPHLGARAALLQTPVPFHSLSNTAMHHDTT